MLTREQIAERAARELHEGDTVHLGEGLARLVANHLPSGVKLVELTAGRLAVDVAVDVAVVTGSQVAHDGGFVGDSLTHGAKKVIVLLEQHQHEDGSSYVRKELAQPASGSALVVITDLAVFDVTAEGLVMREVAPGVSALDVQLKSETPLLASDELKVISV